MVRFCSFWTYLVGNIHGGAWHSDPEVGAVFLEIVFLSQLRCQISRSNHGLEISLTPIFHGDVKLVVVTGASDGGQH